MKEMDDIAQQYYLPVYKYLVSLTKNTHLAEELTQETFYQAVLSIGRFRGDCTLYALLCQIAKHQFYKHLRKAKRHTEFPLPEEDLLSPSLVDEDVLSERKGRWKSTGPSTGWRSLTTRWQTCVCSGT